MPASVEESLAAAREALAGQKYFDGVQAVNAALEAYEDILTAKENAPKVEKLDILRAPQSFLPKMMPILDVNEHKELAQIYATRASALRGLGAQKRALVDIGAALLLTPTDESLLQQKKVLEAESKQANDQNSTGGNKRVPTTIITGFLGAGKTTLLNHILTEEHGKRIAIIENEFGEVGIDDALLQTKSSVTEENVIEMNNGCICCTVRGDLIAGLKKLHKQTTGKGKQLDGIVIETTGLADPAPVAQTFFADDFVQGHMVLDGILTVVDARHCMEHLKEEKPNGIVNEAVEQVAFADRLLLNKTDLVSPEYLEEVQQEIRKINKTAHIKRTQNSKVDMDFIIGIQAFSLDKILMQVNEGFLDEEEAHEHGHEHGGGHDHNEGHGHNCSEEGCDDSSHGHGTEHGAGHGHENSGHGHEDCHDDGCDHPSHKTSKKKKHVHDYRVSSVGITTDHELHKDKLDRFIGWLMQEKGPDLYRSKGVLAVKGMPNKFVFHAVHMQFSGLPQDPWKEGEKRCCKMVFIGKNLNRQELNQKFEECFVRE